MLMVDGNVIYCLGVKTVTLATVSMNITCSLCYYMYVQCVVHESMYSKREVMTSVVCIWSS